MIVRLLVYLFVCLSFCLFVCWLVCLFVCWLVCTCLLQWYRFLCFLDVFWELTKLQTTTKVSFYSEKNTDTVGRETYLISECTIFVPSFPRIIKITIQCISIKKNIRGRTTYEKNWPYSLIVFFSFNFLHDGVVPRLAEGRLSRLTIANKFRVFYEIISIWKTSSSYR